MSEASSVASRALNRGRLQTNAERQSQSRIPVFAALYWHRVASVFHTAPAGSSITEYCLVPPQLFFPPSHSQAAGRVHRPDKPTYRF